MFRLPHIYIKRAPIRVNDIDFVIEDEQAEVAEKQVSFQAREEETMAKQDQEVVDLVPKPPSEKIVLVRELKESKVIIDQPFYEKVVKKKAIEEKKMLIDTPNYAQITMEKELDIPLQVIEEPPKKVKYYSIQSKPLI